MIDIQEILQLNGLEININAIETNFLNEIVNYSLYINGSKIGKFLKKNNKDKWLFENKIHSNKKQNEINKKNFELLKQVLEKIPPFKEKTYKKKWNLFLMADKIIEKKTAFKIIKKEAKKRTLVRLNNKEYFNEFQYEILDYEFNIMNFDKINNYYKEKNTTMQIWNKNQKWNYKYEKEDYIVKIKNNQFTKKNLIVEPQLEDITLY